MQNNMMGTQQQGVHGQFTPNFPQMQNGNGFVNNPNFSQTQNGNGFVQNQVPPQQVPASNSPSNGWVGFQKPSNNTSPPTQNGNSDFLSGKQSAHRDSKNAILGKYKSNPTNEFMTSLGPQNPNAARGGMMMTQLNGMNPMGMNQQPRQMMGMGMNNMGMNGGMNPMAMNGGMNP